MLESAVSADKVPQVMLWGDSHAGHLSGVLSVWANACGKEYINRAFPACPPLWGATPIKGNKVQDGCREHNDAVLNEFRNLVPQGLKTVVLAGRWNSYLSLPETNPAAISSFALLDDHLLRNSTDISFQVGSWPADYQGSLDTLESSLRHTLQILNASGVRILLVAPIPEPYFNAQHCLYRKSEHECRYSRQRVDERRKETLLRLQRASAGLSNVILLDPIGFFCDSAVCRVSNGQMSFYADTDHLTAAAASRLGRAFGAEFAAIF